MSEPQRPASHSPGEFNAMYAAATPPWDIGRPQLAFRILADAGAFGGRVLDIGCGTGEHALMAAQRGLELPASRVAIAEAAARQMSQHQGQSHRM